ncbi:biotin--[acetyl-CoA-carboxylase] ligase [Rosistilla oblonga]|uniref:biotin--[biotin carboxyl-carrier protein] ligase n=1 Tax=Rosistilla oblonga TaxID=2527990 RepID=A0A518ITW4_9BACT|nr:biotin--[acetyl-CoA-carboxylase] ligase [Rosistilla oblonga]QDV56529.1 Bifunctional ligase/repressor BirA [Rosistilla oblonga]
MQVDWQGPDAVLQLLSRSGWLRSIRWVPEVDSTNRLAKSLADQADRPTPMLIVAKSQTQGRGRLGRSWFSDSGTLTFSLMLAAPQLAADRTRWPQLALVAGLAVCDVVGEVVEPVAVQLKWPNDVYLAGGKVAGVLIETAGHDNDHVVIGIGLNVATDLSKAPAEVQQRARSIRDYADHPVETFAVLPEIIDRIAVRIADWRTDSAAIANDFSKVCLLRGRRVAIDTAGQTLEGACLGIDGDGALRVRRDDGEVVEVRSGEVVRWSDEVEVHDG